MSDATERTLLRAFPEGDAEAAISPRKMVIRNVRELHRSGAVSVGEPIPSERELARTLGFHRVTVRRALAVLEEEGFLRLRETGERVVCDAAQAGQKALQTLVAVLMPELPDGDHTHGHVQSGWVEVIGQGAIRALRRAGRRVMILPPDEVDGALLTELRTAAPAGLVIPEILGDGSRMDRVARVAAELPCPVVAYGDHPRWARVDRVTSDHASGCAALFRFLWQRGRRRLLLTMPVSTPENEYWVEQRIVGYERAATEACAGYRRVVRLPEPPTHATWQPEGFAEMVAFHLGHLAEHLVGPEAPDAILCPSDGQVPILAAACRKLHRAPGRDLDIVGYDNYLQDLVEHRLDPYEPPATVDKRNEEIGATMVELLQERLAGSLPDTPQLRIVEPKLIVNTAHPQGVIP